MTQEFKLEDPGEGLTEAEIVEIHVAEGDQVKDGDMLVSVETDKAVNDITAPFDGTIESIEVKEGDLIKVGQTLVTYTAAGAGKREEEPAAESKAESGTAEPEERDTEQAEEEAEEASSAKTEPEPEERKQQAAKERRTAHEDVLPSGPVPAAPATRRLARELDVDLREVEPSGPHGRVTEDDVRAFAKEAPKREEAAPRHAPAKEPTLPDFSQWGETERQPLRSVRRSIARQMQLSWSQIPHVLHQDVADVTELERFRRAHKSEIEERGGKLTLTVLVLKAAVAALKQFPRFNASLDTENDEIVLKHYYHLGLAVATERGLLVPVIRDVDRKDVSQLSVESMEIAERARQGDLKREEMQGASFSLTNPGPIGGTGFAPMINYPEVAILGMGSTRLEPVAIGDIDDYKFEARLRLPLSLSYDHRVNDGADAARFMRTIVDILEDPESFLLAV